MPSPSCRHQDHSRNRLHYRLAALAAATILSKRLSPRKESQHGLKHRSPYEGPFGIVATISSCSSARSRSPVQAYTSARLATYAGPQYESLAIGMRSTVRRASRIASSFRPSPASKTAASSKYSLFLTLVSHVASNLFRAPANTDCAFCLSPRARATCPSAQLS